MATQTNANLRRALLHVIGATTRLLEITGPLPLVEQDLRVALETLGEDVPPALLADDSHLIAALVTPGEIVEVPTGDRGAG